VPIAAAGPATEFTTTAARQLARSITPHRRGSLTAELSDFCESEFSDFCEFTRGRLDLPNIVITPW
jgi:hypothetical protein